MQIEIEAPIRAACPGLALGTVTARVRVRPEDSLLRTNLEKYSEGLRAELAGKELSQIEEIQALRRLYRGLGKDPTRYRGSSEALLRRIVGGKGLYFINTVVDICNRVSIETKHALGAYDLDCVKGRVKLRPAIAGEVYCGIGRGELNLEGLPVFSDDLGPFGSPTSDSERTKISLETKRMAFVIVACCRRERLPADMELTAELLRRFGEAVEVESGIVA